MQLRLEGLCLEEIGKKLVICKAARHGKTLHAFENAINKSGVHRKGGSGTKRQAGILLDYGLQKAPSCGTPKSQVDVLYAHVAFRFDQL